MYVYIYVYIYVYVYKSIIPGKNNIFHQSLLIGCPSTTASVQPDEPEIWSSSSLAINFSTSIWKKFSEFSMTLSHSRAMTYVARKHMGWVNKWWKHIKGWDVGSQLQVDVWDCNWTQIWWHLRWQYTWNHSQVAWYFQTKPGCLFDYPTVPERQPCLKKNLPHHPLDAHSSEQFLPHKMTQVPQTGQSILQTHCWGYPSHLGVGQKFANLKMPEKKTHE